MRKRLSSLHSSTTASGDGGFGRIGPSGREIAVRKNRSPCRCARAFAGTGTDEKALVAGRAARATGHEGERAACLVTADGAEPIRDRSPAADGREDAPPFAREHVGEHRASGVDVRHHVDVDDSPPISVRNLFASRNRNPGIRTEDVDASVRFDRAGDESLHVTFDGNVRPNENAADGFGAGPGLDRPDPRRRRAPRHARTAPQSATTPSRHPSRRLLCRRSSSGELTPRADDGQSCWLVQRYGFDFEMPSGAFGAAGVTTGSGRGCRRRRGSAEPWSTWMRGAR